MTLRADNLATLRSAGEALLHAKRVLITTGAGMSAESGIPTYRDKEGLWTRLEPFASRGVNPSQVAHQDGYERDPAQAWGVHEWLRNRIDAAPLHRGYGVITRLLARIPNAFLLTTNVDGLHLRAGVSHHQLWERYGSLWELQCARGCTTATWPDRRPKIAEINPETLAAVGGPLCPFCGAAARPSVQLDHDDLFQQHAASAERYARFVSEPIDICIAVGTTLWLSWPEQIASPRVIHINPDAATHARYENPIALTMGAEHALLGLEWMLDELQPARRAP